MQHLQIAPTAAVSRIRRWAGTAYTSIWWWAIVAVAVIVAAALICACMPRPRPVRIRPAPPKTEQPAPVREPATPVEPRPDDEFRIQLVENARDVVIDAESGIKVEFHTGAQRLPSGSWTVRATESRAPAYRYHVFRRRFEAGEQREAEAFAEDWRREGFPAEVVTLGKRVAIQGGGYLDNRQFWVSLDRFDSAAEAEALRARMEACDEWTWVRGRKADEGRITVSFEGPQGQRATRMEGPVRIESERPVALRNPDKGVYAGVLEIAPGRDGGIAVYERIGMEDYLAGVLPVEMPALWPMEALKAQAVAARTETLVNSIDKHAFDGFDFCTHEHCRMYAGYGRWHPRATEAIERTAGQVLGLGGELVPAVFSANCGGWGENNDNVWDSKPHRALRGARDGPNPGAAPIGDPGGWIRSRPQAYCSADQQNYRWTRRMSRAELTEAVNRRYSVGSVQRVEPGERGVSGRLKSVRIVGASDAVTIDRENAIRLALGNLPSALFIVSNEGNNFVFSGAGRGHGVGLCQHGARGRAEAGHSYERILAHYFQGARIENQQPQR